jgi:2-polyprenyl-3-methyl-5-hydroxy-6-metoxy-1,4-benzoquinol methylase
VAGTVSEPGSRIEDLVNRLERERLEADRLYNEALTAVDRAIHTTPSSDGALPPGYDSERLADVNASWDLLATNGLPGDRSRLWPARRLRAFIWRLLGPPLEIQRRFNAALVDHLNRNALAHRERARALQELVESTRRELAALARFESLLVQYLQTITVYVDSRDRAVGGAEIRERVALNEQRLLALKRMVEATGREGPAREHDAAGNTSARGSGPEPGAFTGELDSLTYMAFEDRFRGPQTDIGKRVEEYLPLLASATDVVDIGCGRGELLGALASCGVTARGVDISPAMVELSRSKGFEAELGDALSYLERQRPESIGGLVAVQVVEHFTPAYLTRFLDAAFQAMRPGAPLILETINPACWMAFFETYLRDVTHQQPLHADTLKLLVQAAGFGQVDVQFRRPVRDSDRLAAVPVTAAAPGLDAITAAINDHAEKLNARIFSFMDYVVIARR